MSEDIDDPRRPRRIRPTLIKATGEGRERAKGPGVRFGRPLKLSPHQRREAIERLDAGDAVVDVPARLRHDLLTSAKKARRTLGSRTSVNARPLTICAPGDLRIRSPARKQVSGDIAVVLSIATTSVISLTGPRSPRSASRRMRNATSDFCVRACRSGERLSQASHQKPLANHRFRILSTILEPSRLTPPSAETIGQFWPESTVSEDFFCVAPQHMGLPPLKAFMFFHEFGQGRFVQFVQDVAELLIVGSPRSE
jgi:hypothetical protein